MFRLREVIHQFLLFEREFLETGNLVTEYFDICEFLHIMIESADLKPFLLLRMAGI
jgi:hypothetical protein